MKLFWEWMIKNKYAVTEENEDIIYYGYEFEYDNRYFLSKQMLIGYMIEYLFFSGYDCDILSGMKYNTHDIDDFYNYLVEKIEEIK
jgi:hypothetical protein